MHKSTITRHASQLIWLSSVLLVVSTGMFVGCFNLGQDGGQTDTDPPPAQPLDSDGDSVADAADACPNTSTGAEADESGCAASQRDTDVDGVTDDLDQCSGTEPDREVDDVGCPAGEAPRPIPGQVTLAIGVEGQGAVNPASGVLNLANRSHSRQRRRTAGGLTVGRGTRLASPTP